MAAASPPSPAPHLKHRVGLSLEAQADAEKLATLYTSMATKTLSSGLDAGAVTATAPYYRRGGDGGASPAPLDYTALTPPLTPESVRLLVFFLESATLHAACDAAVAALRKSLPAGAALHASLPGSRHVTLFQTSHPQCLWPGGAYMRAAVPPPGAPAPGAVDFEVAATRALAASHPPPRLTAHSIALAPSGTLLLLLTEGGGGDDGAPPGGVVAALRSAAAAALPGCPVRQPAIMHVTLGRMITDLSVQAAREAAAAVARVPVAGLAFTPSCLSHVCEATFATVQGARVDAAWGGAA